MWKNILGAPQGASNGRPAAMHSATLPMGEAVRKPDMAVAFVLAGLAGSFGKHYCYPTHQTILRLLRTRYGRVMTPRTLCRHLNGLERGGWLQRRRRHERDRVAGRGWIFKSTLYRIPPRLLDLLGQNSRAFGRVAGAIITAGTAARDVHSRVTKAAHNVLLSFKAIIENPVIHSPTPHLRR